MGARLAGGQPEQRPARETLGAVLEVLLCAVDEQLKKQVIYVICELCGGVGTQKATNL